MPSFHPPRCTATTHLGLARLSKWLAKVSIFDVEVRTLVDRGRNFICKCLSKRQRDLVQSAHARHTQSRTVNKCDGKWPSKDDVLGYFHTQALQADDDNVHGDELGHGLHAERGDLTAAPTQKPTSALRPTTNDDSIASPN